MPTLPTYPWFDVVPENFKTRNQLSELGLKPGGPKVAEVVWDRGKKYAYLYDVGQAVAKRPLSAQAAATIGSRKLARRTCPVCRRVLDHILRAPTCDECMDYFPTGATRRGGFDLHWGDRHTRIYRVWLPVETAIGPHAAPVTERWRYAEWIPYPKTEFRLVLSDRDYGPLLPNHTHTEFYGRPIGDLLKEWSAQEFLLLATEWPILRAWAIDASLPDATYMNHALIGLEREDAAELKFLWYEHRTTYYRDMKRWE